MKTFGTVTRFGFKRLTLVYLFALALIALVNIAAFWIVSRVVDQFSEYAPLINISGRQRMLSQKLSKESLQLLLAEPGPEYHKVKEQLGSTLNSWSRVHNKLAEGAKLDGLDYTKVSQSMAQVGKHQEEVRLLVDDLLALDHSRLHVDRRAVLVDSILDSSDRFLQAMEGAVAKYEHMAQLRAARLQWVEGGILLAALVLLALEGLCIFRPMIARVFESVAKLKSTNAQLAQEVSDRIRAEKEREDLRGLLPICSSCKKIRDRSGDWRLLEEYIENRTSAQFTHGLCDGCLHELYPQVERLK